MLVTPTKEKRMMEEVHDFCLFSKMSIIIKNTAPFMNTKHRKMLLAPQTQTNNLYYRHVQFPHLFVR